MALEEKDCVSQGSTVFFTWFREHLGPCRSISSRRTDRTRERHQRTNNRTLGLGLRVRHQQNIKMSERRRTGSTDPKPNVIAASRHVPQEWG